MAWSQLYNFGGFTPDSICSDDGDRLFYADYLNTDAYYYSISGDSITQVASSAASFDSATMGDTDRNMVYFNGGLYAIVRAGSTYDLSVWKWDGSGTSWTMVYDFGSSNITHCSIACSDTQIVAIGYQSNLETNYEIAYSSDGSSWSSGSRTLTPAPPVIPIPPYGNLIFQIRNSPHSPNGVFAFWYQWYAALYRAAYILDWGSTAFTTSKYFTYDWNGGAPISAGDSWVETDYEGVDMRHWRYDTAWKHSETLASWYTPTSGIVPSLRTYGMASYSLGIRTADGYLCGLTTGDWTALEEIYAGAVTTMYALIRLSGNYYPYAFIRVGGSRYIYGKGSALSDPGDPSSSELHFGHSTLQYVADLPFIKCAPQGMALKESLGTLVIGSRVEDSEMVVYAEHPYTGPIESDEGIPTGTSISAIRWV